MPRRGSRLYSGGIGMVQAVPTLPSPHPLVVVVREGGKEGESVGDLGQSSLPKPLPTWALKGAAVF